MFESSERVGVREIPGLNAEQVAVTEFDGGSLRVMAGAGTGKTTALTGRVARLISGGTDPQRILLLTFTRRAAAELLNRADAMLRTQRSESRDRDRSMPASGKVLGGTFHSIAHRTLRRNATRLGLSPGFTVIDPSDAADLIDLIREEVVGSVTSRRRFPRKATLTEMYSRAVNTGDPLSSVARLVAPWCLDSLDAVSKICGEYVVRKRRLDFVDFDDLLLLWRQALRDEAIGPELAASYDHVLVDEYQDVNRLQVEVLQLMRGADPRLTVVGDDAQAIYSFRAADPRHILDFEADFPGAQTLRLSTNYRSSPAVISLANALASDAPHGFSIRLRPSEKWQGAGTPPKLVRCVDEQDQSIAVCEQVLAHRESGTPLRQQAVLVRASHHTSHLELELARRAVPFVKYGGLRYLEAAHVKDLLAAFRIADNPRDELSWFRLLQLLDGVGPATARRATVALGLHVRAGDSGVFDRWPLAAAELPAAVRDFGSGLAEACRSRPAEPVSSHAHRLRDAIRPLIEFKYDDYEPRLADLDALVDAASVSGSLSDVAADHALDPPRSAGALAGPPVIDDDWLVLSTVHSAKGLEWDIVHILHAADGNFPSDMALTDEAGLEEERRLFYVAATRPRRGLNVYVPLRYHHHPRARDDRHSWSQPSRFLSERVRTHLDERSRIPERTTLGLASSGRDVASAVEADLAGLWTS